MEKCSSGKRIFETLSLATDALIQNHVMNDYRQNEGPNNIYQCDQCGCWHFTSKGEKHELLDDPDMVRHIERERRAYMWERSLK